MPPRGGLASRVWGECCFGKNTDFQKLPTHPALLLKKKKKPPSEFTCFEFYSFFPLPSLPFKSTFQFPRKENPHPSPLLSRFPFPLLHFILAERLITSTTWISFSPLRETHLLSPSSNRTFPPLSSLISSVWKWFMTRHWIFLRGKLWQFVQADVSDGRYVLIYVLIRVLCVFR